MTDADHLSPEEVDAMLRDEESIFHWMWTKVSLPLCVVGRRCPSESVVHSSVSRRCLFVHVQRGVSITSCLTASSRGGLQVRGSLLECEES